MDINLIETKPTSGIDTGHKEEYQQDPHKCIQNLKWIQVVANQERSQIEKFIQTIDTIVYRVTSSTK